MPTASLTVVAGLPGSGTSAVTGTLMKNRYYNRYYARGDTAPTFEAQCAMEEVGMFQLLPKGLNRSYFDRYKQEAAKYGYDKAVVKMLWRVLWEPEVLQDVNVLLIYREDILNCQKLRMERIRSRYPNPEDMVRLGQSRILQLHEEYGWPIFRYGQTHEDLEAIVGHKLPVRHIR